MDILSEPVGQFLQPYSFFFNQLHFDIADLLLGWVIYLQQPFHLWRRVTDGGAVPLQPRASQRAKVSVLLPLGSSAELFPVSIFGDS